MTQISVQRLFDETRKKLDLNWIAGATGGSKLLTSETVQKPSLALIGHLNFVHPNRVQILGAAEMGYLRELGSEGLVQAVNNLYSTELAAVVIANNEPVPQELLDAANRTETALFVSPQSSIGLMQILTHYLAKTLADSVTLHGVFMEVMGLGVLITGDAAIGKSELALDLITRGHRLIADDIVELYQIAPDTLEGRCPSMLQDFIEVRGLGVLNIRALFGEVAVKPKKTLRFIVHLEKPADITKVAYDRLSMQQDAQDILGVAISKVRLPVAAGRNLAVLVEVAVRAYIMQLRGISSSQQFIERQQRYLEEKQSRNEP